MSSFRLKLFVCGMTQVSEQAVANLRNFLATEPAIECDLTIVDVLDRPDLAEADSVVVTPTLIKEMPPPRQLFVGDLTDTDHLRIALGLGSAGNGDKNQ